MIKLTDQQIKYLSIFNGLKSAFRQAELNKHLGVDLQKSIESELITLNVLKKTKSGALKANYDYYGLNDLISLNRESIDDMINALRDSEGQLSQKIEQDKRLSATDKHYFLYQREILESIGYRQKEIDRLKNRINLKQQFDKKF